MSNLVYDNSWLISLSNIPTIDMGQYNGAFTGNGKVGLYASMNSISTTKTYISANLNFSQIGKYRNNIIQGFDMNTVKFIHNTNSNISYSLVHQSLDMSSGSVETKYTVSSNDIDIVNATHTLTPLRQYPFCVMQTIEFNVSSDLASLDVYHELSGDTNFINDMDFNNNVIYNERIYSDKGLYILNAVGNLNRLGVDGRHTKIAGASCYLFENDEIVNVLGFNGYNNLAACYQKLRFTSLQEGVTYKFHILGAQMTGFDFPEPLEEVKRILLNIAFKHENIITLAERIMLEHTSMWDKLWESDILLEPKANITTEEASQVMQVKQYVRYSLYNVYTSIRDGINTEVNPLNLSYIDANGNIFFDGDLWMVPILLFIKPDMAKTILEFRYKNLEQATQLAASFGYKGSKFPYQDDVIGYNSQYWDVISPLQVFNNALIAINVWNYYRVTLDREWLSTKGYQMMKNIADFLVSIISIDEEGNYHLLNVTGLSERISSNHALTVYLSKLALKFIIEASYELNFIPKTGWIDAFINLDIVTLSDDNCAVINYDDEYQGEDIDVLDNLILLLPYYSSLYFTPNKPCRDTESIKSNLDYYISRISEKYANDPLNNMLITALYGTVIQTNTSQLTTFYDKLSIVLNQNVNELWGHFNRVNPTIGSDVSLSACFIMVFLNCIGGLRIQGGVTESKFYYEEFGIYGTYFANMPSTWKNIKLKGIGPIKELYNVVNNNYYT
jgi:trehalose/maltose hydrolase-like predicted phosphorylase